MKDINDLATRLRNRRFTQKEINEAADVMIRQQLKIIEQDQQIKDLQDRMRAVLIDQDYRGKTK